MKKELNKDDLIEDNNELYKNSIDSKHLENNNLKYNKTLFETKDDYYNSEINKASKNNKIHLKESKRFEMFLEISKMDGHVWEKSHHIFNIQSNVAICCLMIYTFYRYNINRNEHLNFFNQSFKTMLKFSLGMFLSFTLIVLKYKYFKRYIYDNYYSKKQIDDYEFSQIYDEIVIAKQLNQI